MKYLKTIKNHTPQNLAENSLFHEKVCGNKACSDQPGNLELYDTSKTYISDVCKLLTFLDNTMKTPAECWK